MRSVWKLRRNGISSIYPKELEVFSAVLLKILWREGWCTVVATEQSVVEQVFADKLLIFWLYCHVFYIFLTTACVLICVKGSGHHFHICVRTYRCYNCAHVWETIIKFSQVSLTLKPYKSPVLIQEASQALSEWAVLVQVAVLRLIIKGNYGWCGAWPVVWFLVWKGYNRLAFPCWAGRFACLVHVFINDRQCRWSSLNALCFWTVLLLLVLTKAQVWKLQLAISKVGIFGFISQRSYL